MPLKRSVNPEQGCIVDRSMPTGGQDRFIPNRREMNLSERPLFWIKEVDSSKQSPMRRAFNECMAQNLGVTKTKILSFKTKAPAVPVNGFQSQLKIVYTQNKTHLVPKPLRYICSTPEKVLDAPELMDDYYLNLLDWGVSNVLAVALGQALYLWNAELGTIKELCQSSNEEDYITSVKFVAEGGTFLAVGTAFAETQLWDIEAGKILRTMKGHNDRVSSLCWNEHILTSCGRDSLIINHDVRVADHVVNKLVGHEQEICGLAWSPDGNTLASGGNDNMLCLWDAKNGLGSGRVWHPRLVLREHNAAVKAISWSPHQSNVLATGAGTSDRCIKIWNPCNGKVVHSVDTGSQVCSLLWNPHEEELLSSHGFTENQLTLWKYPGMLRVKELKGHTSRVLYTTISPCGTIVCSASADESLRFWKVFETSKKTHTVASDGARQASRFHKMDGLR